MTLFALVAATALAIGAGDKCRDRNGDGIIDYTGECEFVRTKVEDAAPQSHCLRWLDGTIEWVQNAEGYDLQDGRDEFAAIERSFARWNAVSLACGNLNLVQGARVADRKVGYDQSGGTNRNLILFRKKLCSEVVPKGTACLSQRRGSCANEYDCWDYPKETIALTTITFNPNNGVIVDSDIEYNASRPGGFVFTVVDSPKCSSGNQHQDCVATDIENTTTHEVGHFLGLDHTDYPGSTMNPTAVLGETSKRAVDAGSESFICESYPKGKASLACRVDALSKELGTASGCAAAGGATATSALGGFAAMWLVFRRRVNGQRRGLGE